MHLRIYKITLVNQVNHLIFNHRFSTWIAADVISPRDAYLIVRYNILSIYHLSKGIRERVTFYCYDLLKNCSNMFHKSISHEIYICVYVVNHTHIDIIFFIKGKEKVCILLKINLLCLTLHTQKNNQIYIIKNNNDIHFLKLYNYIIWTQRDYEETACVRIVNIMNVIIFLSLSKSCLYNHRKLYFQIFSEYREQKRARNNDTVSRQIIG